MNDKLNQSMHRKPSQHLSGAAQRVNLLDTSPILDVAFLTYCIRNFIQQ